MSRLHCASSNSLIALLLLSGCRCFKPAIQIEPERHSHGSLHCPHSCTCKIPWPLERCSFDSFQHVPTGPAAERFQLHCRHLCDGTGNAVATCRTTLQYHAGQRGSGQPRELQRPLECLCKSRAMELGPASSVFPPSCQACPRCGKHKYRYQCLQANRRVEGGYGDSVAFCCAPRPCDHRDLQCPPQHMRVSMADGVGSDQEDAQGSAPAG